MHGGRLAFDEFRDLEGCLGELALGNDPRESCRRSA